MLTNTIKAHDFSRYVEVSCIPLKSSIKNCKWTRRNKKPRKWLRFFTVRHIYTGLIKKHSVLWIFRGVLSSLEIYWPLHFLVNHRVCCRNKLQTCIAQNVIVFLKFWNHYFRTKWTYLTIHITVCRCVVLWLLLLLYCAF